MQSGLPVRNAPVKGDIFEQEASCGEIQSHFSRLGESQSCSLGQTAQRCTNSCCNQIVRSKQTFEITKIPTELNFCGDHGYTSRNKIPKVPIDPMCAKVNGRHFGFFFSRNCKFFENIAQTKIVDHKIIYKKGPHFFP